MPLTDNEIIKFANHAADRIPASNYEGRVIHAFRMADDLVPLEKLRALRLWHWKECQKHRRSEQTFAKLAIDFSFNSKYHERLSVKHKVKANLHLEWVQTLNDFFPIGDTAEKDAAK